MRLSYRNLLFFCIIALTQIVYGQAESYDKVVLLDGEEKIGKVTEIADDYIKFIHKGESLTYTINKAKINKVQFSSGRIEFFSNHAEPSGSDSLHTDALQAHQNIIAVLPFIYIQEGGSKDQKMGSKVQSDCYSVLKRYASQFELQDPLFTNAQLLKHNITEETIAAFTPGEIANILNTEYIIYGTVTVNGKGAKTGSSSYSTGKTKGNKFSDYLSSSSSTTPIFSTSVDIKIYTDLGQNIFSQSHESFWQTEDAYSITLQYLVKRSPLYRK
jgi:hypothetical protein